MITDQWDAFLSYASEDREAVAQPLYHLLTEFGLRIWFDQTELRIGDSLRQRIDSGLAKSRRGIVVLSPFFFAKHYPQQELNGLAQKEVEGESVILPVWHNVDAGQVRGYSPTLADRVAVKSSDGLEMVAATLLLSLRPNYPEELAAAAEKIRALPEITTGRELFALTANAQAAKIYDDPVENEEEAELIGGLKTTVSEITDFAEDVSPTEELHWQLSLNRDLAATNRAGWKVFGTRPLLPFKHLVHPQLDTAVVALLKGARSAFLVDGQLLVARPKPPSGYTKNGDLDAR